MPKHIENILKKEAMKKFHTLESPRAKAYVYGTLHKIENPSFALGLSYHSIKKSLHTTTKHIKRHV